MGISKSVLPWVREGWTSVLYQVGFLDGKGQLIKDPVWKEIGVDVPSIAEVYRLIYGKNPSGPAWEAEKALVGGYSLTRIIAFSPKTPSARVTELRQAFQAMGKDPPFLGNGRKVRGRRRAWCREMKPEVSPPLFSKRQRKP